MNTDIKTIKALPDFKLQVELADGSRGVFDLRPHLGHPGMAALTDPAYFSRVTVLLGAATWAVKISRPRLWPRNCSLCRWPDAHPHFTPPPNTPAPRRTPT